MPHLLVIATHSGIVTNVIVCDNVEYAKEAEHFFEKCSARLQTKILPMSKEYNQFFGAYICRPKSAYPYSD